jgi:two-component system sensor histidine kinase DesK
VRRRWSELSGVERVGLYTRVSLYVVLWGFIAWVVLANALGHGGRTVALLGGAAALTALGFTATRALLRRYPAVHPLPWRVLGALLAGAAALYVVALAAWSGDVRGTAVVVVIANLTVPLAIVPGRRVALGLLAGGAALAGFAGGEVVNALAGVITAGSLLFTVRASMWVLGIVTELDTARQAQAQLAVVEERLRFSRDVHDVLGRRLSTIAVQAELAATLAMRGEERAAERMLEVRSVAHDALREARELARGYRTTTLAQELEGARSLLRSAGIDVSLDVEDMPRAWHEAAGWIVRESVTNVLRHSSATRVEVGYADARLRIVNDGAGPGGSADGSGLQGLRERLAPLGATLEAQPDGDGRWAVLATLPGTGPLSAGTGP